MRAEGALGLGLGVGVVRVVAIGAPKKPAQRDTALVRPRLQRRGNLGLEGHGGSAARLGGDGDGGVDLVDEGEVVVAEGVVGRDVHQTV